MAHHILNHNTLNHHMLNHHMLPSYCMLSHHTLNFHMLVHHKLTHYVVKHQISIYIWDPCAGCVLILVVKLASKIAAARLQHASAECHSYLMVSMGVSTILHPRQPSMILGFSSH